MSRKRLQGAEATTALAIATIPFGGEAQVEGTLEQLLAGALKALKEAGCSLIGGHTCEGAELALGLSVNGVVRGGTGSLLNKGGGKAGDALVLTKAVSCLLRWFGPVRRNFLARCGAVRCGAVRCGAVRCGAVRCGAVRCGVVRCGAVRCGAVRCGAVRCGAVRCGAVRCGLVRCSVMWFGAVPLFLSCHVEVLSLSQVRGLRAVRCFCRRHRVDTA